MGLLDAFLEGREEGKKEVSPPDAGRKMRKFIADTPAMGVHFATSIRASEAHSVCPRQFVLDYWCPGPGGLPGFNSLLYMGAGHFFHAFLQDVVLGPMRVLWGDWVNTNDGSVVEGFHPCPELSLRETAKEHPLTWRYREPSCWNEEYRISGHADGRVNVRLVPEDPPDAVLEIKSTGAYGFGKITDAASISEAYRTQATLYQWLLGYSQTVFLFLNRNNMQVKTLIYAGEPGLLRDVQHKAKKIWNAIRCRTLPDGLLPCRDPRDTRAKQCGQRERCWSTLPASFDGAVNFEEWTHLCEERKDAT